MLSGFRTLDVGFTYKEEIIMCSHCLTDDRIATTTTFTVEYNSCIIVIKNVPCLECSMCCEIIFTDEVSARFESMVEAAKTIMQDIAVIDYTKAA